MIYTGFTDEAGFKLASQIKATRQLGWNHLEFRSIEGKCLHQYSEDEVRAIQDQLAASDISISGIGSSVANWSRSIDDPIDEDVKEVELLIPRMQIFKTDKVRIMSYRPRGDWFDTDQKAGERFERLRRLCAMFKDAGIQPMHENCANYGGMGWKYTLQLLEEVPGLTLAFDTSNPANTPDVSGGDRNKRQSPWDFYQHVKPYIDSVHIKDSFWRGEDSPNLFHKVDYIYPGEGEGDVVRIVEDLVLSGYDKIIAMEPHMMYPAHGSGEYPDNEEEQRAIYVEYGRRFEAIVRNAREKTESDAAFAQC